MTIDDWKTIASFSGAVALLWNVLSFLFNGTWPSFHLAPVTYMTPEGWARVVVTNGSKKPLQITGIWAFPPGSGIGLLHEHSTTGAVVRNALDWGKSTWRKPFPLYLAPESSQNLDVNGFSDSEHALMLIWWHRFWMLPLRLPSILMITRARLDAVQKGSYSKK